MIDFLKANWSDIFAHIAQHVWLVFISIAIAVLIALPVGILITRRKSLRAPLLGIANVIRIDGLRDVQGGLVDVIGRQHRAAP